MKSVRKVWQESASLLLLSKNPSSQKSNFNYDILVMKRSTGSKFMANAIVFPGGVIEKSDSTGNWLDLYAKVGVPDDRLKALRSSLNTDFIYQKSLEEEKIERELSLRISAIRETFEEVGILLAKGQSDLKEDSTGTSSALTGFDVTYWQKEVQKHPSRFYDLCQTLQVVPDVFSLHGWSNWMTPTTVGKHRFDTIFYVASLNERPELAMDQKEVQHVLWANPEELIESNRAGTIWLPPPQIYELSKFNQVKDFEEISQFSQWRSQFGTTLYFPVQYSTKDQLMHLLPGDELYPEQPNYYEKHADYDQYADKTIQELLDGTKSHHRIVYDNISSKGLHINIEPERQHLCPLGRKSLKSFNELKTKAKL